MSKTTFDAPANIAFIKYWGAKDLDRALPLNTSISMTLESCSTRCTAELLEAGHADEVWISEPDGGFRRPAHEFEERVRAHLERMRRWAGRQEAFRIATRNSFPSAAGLASSASGFAALTLATAAALGKNDVAPDELSRLARESGSGSASRSVFGGFVEWPATPATSATSAERSHGVEIADAEHWDLRDIIAVVEIGPKVVSSLEGHRRAHTSPYLDKRLELLPERTERVRRAIAERDLSLLGPAIEEEAVDLHIVAMSSKPPVFYWSPGTIGVLRAVRELRQEGIHAYATMDAGANVHVICEAEAEDDVAARLDSLPVVGFVIRDSVGDGPEQVAQHLF